MKRRYTKEPVRKPAIGHLDVLLEPGVHTLSELPYAIQIVGDVPVRVVIHTNDGRAVLITLGVT